MYACPHCKTNVQDFEMACPHCKGDLKIMALLNQLPDVQFNRALSAARSGDWHTASAQLGAVLSVRMTDIDAWLLLGTVYARCGILALAGQCWQMVLMLRPNDPRAKKGLETIEQLNSQDSRGTE